MTKRLAEIVEVPFGEKLQLDNFFRNNPLMLSISREEGILGLNEMILQIKGNILTTITWYNSSVNIEKSEYRINAKGLKYIRGEIVEKGHKEYDNYKEILLAGGLSLA